jgi:predicted lipid-binding transport protein (Tim44 family)
MRRVVTQGVVLSALLAWIVLSVAQNVTPQQQPAQQSQHVAQPGSNAAAGASGETGTVVGGGAGGAFGGLSAVALVTLAVVAAVAVAAVSNDTTSPAPAPQQTTTR